MIQLDKHLNSIAGFLYHKGLNFDNFCIDKANELINETCLPTKLKIILNENKNQILNILKNNY